MVSGRTVRLGFIISLHLAYFALIVWQAFTQLKIHGDKRKSASLWLTSVREWLEKDETPRTDHNITIAWTCLGGIFIILSPFLSNKFM